MDGWMDSSYSIHLAIEEIMEIKKKYKSKFWPSFIQFTFKLTEKLRLKNMKSAKCTCLGLKIPQGLTSDKFKLTRAFIWLTPTFAKVMFNMIFLLLMKFYFITLTTHTLWYKADLQ